MALTFPAPIYGPIHSRRLGISLGINLMPADGKVCTFDCIYCECGFNRDFIPHTPRPTIGEFEEKLEEKLREMSTAGQLPDVLTFAGNGEPTAHPHFAEIIDITLRLRNKYCPKAKVSVLTNATFIHRTAVHNALMKVDNNIEKLDTVTMDYIQLVDQPQSPSYDVEKVIDNLCSFNGHCIIQTMFMTGIYNGKSVDNTNEKYIAPWLEALLRIRPQSVMIYTIDRATPATGLEKATPAVLDAIAARVEALGIPCSVSY